MKTATTIWRGNTRKIAYFDGNDAVVKPIEYLADQIRPKDLIVVNDSATTPASIMASNQNGDRFELRLLKTSEPPGTMRAVAFKDGDWRIPTEARKPHEFKSTGSQITVANRQATITEVNGPILTFSFSDDQSLELDQIYRYGNAVQYSYMREEVPVWATQTIFASRSWSSEAPSATYALNWKLIFKILEKDASLTAISHAAGLSSIGNEKEDALLPLPEVSQVPISVLERIANVKRRQKEGEGGRVIAIGTSVVRAVESAMERWIEGNHSDKPFTNTLVMSSNRSSTVFDGVLSGLHDVTETHFRLLSSFCSTERIIQLLKVAEKSDCLTHEFGDFMLLFR